MRELTTQMFRYNGTEVAQTSYKGVMGDNRFGGWSQDLGSPGCDHWTGCTGLFYKNVYQEPISLERISDGLSHTLMVGEDVPEYNVHSFWIHTDCDYSSTYAPLNYMPIPPTPLEWWDVISFRSRHPGGAHFCMADGSVHFVSEQIDYVLYQQLSTRAGGEGVRLP